ncbi:unnamed protein product (macronuclear) [Paramecium tetraurelia]|uniref:Transmembrane protein n=1 Tax=Paramecium tetraurelia TaxID=5888 RepID=A0DII7_PARTE|nr:uncharacterized protein GSPATT00039518001 [Paramecium tetraurelia]CAK82854.1 unnamed protein product [Paramecium tetraurelia]|eukprot:XP_001450251.1 hypothetical protein (macronuclear) [Paramecium tetraurelia strain d4-2]
MVNEQGLLITRGEYCSQKALVNGMNSNYKNCEQSQSDQYQLENQQYIQCSNIVKILKEIIQLCINNWNKLQKRLNCKHRYTFLTPYYINIIETSYKLFYLSKKLQLIILSSSKQSTNCSPKKNLQLQRNSCQQDSQILQFLSLKEEQINLNNTLATIFHTKKYKNKNAYQQQSSKCIQLLFYTQQQNDIIDIFLLNLLGFITLGNRY